MNRKITKTIRARGGPGGEKGRAAEKGSKARAEKSGER